MSLSKNISTPSTFLFILSTDSLIISSRKPYDVCIVKSFDKQTVAQILLSVFCSLFHDPEQQCSCNCTVRAQYLLHVCLAVLEELLYSVETPLVDRM